MPSENITKRSVIDDERGIVVDELTGIISLLIHLDVYALGALATRTPHRSRIEPGMDVEAWIAMINIAIPRDFGFPAPTDEQWDKLRTAAAEAWTPEVIARWQELQTAEEAAWQAVLGPPVDLTAQAYQ